MDNLHEWSQQALGARLLLNKLRDCGVCLDKGKDAKVYSDAIYDLLLSGPDAIWQFYGEQKPIHFRNFQKNARGKLISCEAYFE